MSIRFVSFLASVILIAGRSVINIDGSVIKDKPVPIEMVPYQVSIQLRNLHTCSGSIIDSKFVLTSGVCAKYSPSEYRIQAGSSRQSIGGSMHTVTRIIEIPYSDKQNSSWNDLALFEISPPFKFDETRAKIPLSEKETPAGSNAIAVGWSKLMETESIDDPFILQAVDVPIVDRDYCRKEYKNFAGDMENLICTDFAGINFLFGVSGGPLVIDGVQVGVFSWGQYSNEIVKPDVYTEVAKYKSQIRMYVPDI